MGNFVKRSQVEPALDYDSGTATRNGVVIDCRGFNAVAFMLHLGTVVAGGDHQLKVQGGNLLDGSDMADLEGTGEAVLGVDSNAIKIVDIGHPRFRYLRCVVVKDGTNACAESAVAVLYNGGIEPVTQGEWINAVQVHAPLAGTP